MNKIKIILSYLLGFILGMIGVLLVVVLVLKSSVFSIKYIKNEFSKTDYYSNIYNEIVLGMKDYIAPTGLPDSIIDGVITKEEVEIEINKYLDNLYNGKTYYVNADGIEEKVKKNVDNYLKKHNVRMDETEEFNKFVSNLKNVYNNEVRLYKLLDRYAGLISKVCKSIDRYLVILSVLYVIIMVLLLLINPSVVSSSIMSSGIILILMRLFIIEDISINYITIFNDYFSLIVRNIFMFFSENILFLGICLSVLGFFISLFVSKNKFSLKK